MLESCPRLQQLSVVALRILETTLQSWSVAALRSAAQRCSVGALLRSGFAFSCFCVGGDPFLQEFSPSPPCGWGCLPSGFLPLRGRANGTAQQRCVVELDRQRCSVAWWWCCVCHHNAAELQSCEVIPTLQSCAQNSAAAL